MITTPLSRSSSRATGARLPPARLVESVEAENCRLAHGGVEAVLGGGEPGGRPAGFGLERVLHVVDDPRQPSGMGDEVGFAVAEYQLLVDPESPDAHHEDDAEHQRKQRNGGSRERNQSDVGVEAVHRVEVKARLGDADGAGGTGDRPGRGRRPVPGGGPVRPPSPPAPRREIRSRWCRWPCCCRPPARNPPSRRRHRA